MLVTVKTFDGHNINDGSDYEAMVLGIGSPQNASPVFVQRANADAKYAGVFSMDIKNIPVDIYIRDYSDRYALIAQLKTWLRPRTNGYLSFFADVFVSGGVAATTSPSFFLRIQ